MAATILAGSIGTLAIASVRAAGAAGGNTLQAQGFTALSNGQATAEHHVELSPRGRGRKLQDEDDDDQCGSEITVTSTLFSDAEGCYEYVDGLYYLSADEENAIASTTLAVGGVDLGQVWGYGSFANDDDASQLLVSAVCYYGDADVSLDEIPEWQCQTDEVSLSFDTVSAEEFSVSCGCSETSAPTESGTSGEFTDMPTTPPTIAPTMSPTDMPTMFPTGMPTMSPTGMPTMSPTGMPTMSSTDVPTMSPTGMPTSSDRSVGSSSSASPTASPSGAPSGSGTDVVNAGTLPFKMSALGMVGASAVAIFVGLMPFVV